MPAFLVQLPDNARFTLPDGADSMVVFATDAADALAITQAEFSGDSDAAWAAATATELVASADLTGYEMRVAILDSTPVIDNTAPGVLGVDTVAVNDGGTATYAIDDILTAVGGTFTRAATFRVITVSTGVILTVELVDAGEYTVAPTPLTANPVTGGGGTVATLDLTTNTVAYANLMAQMVGLLNAESIIAGASVDMSDGAAGTSLFTIATGGGGDDLGDLQVVAELRKTATKTAIPGLLGAIVDEGSSTDVLTVAVIQAPVLPNMVARLKTA
jgi:hypothetical protein